MSLWYINQNWAHGLLSVVRVLQKVNPQVTLVLTSTVINLYSLAQQLPFITYFILSHSHICSADVVKGQD